MSQKLPPDFCPYKGLQPYTEQDCAFFFGRTRDQQIIISNLYAAQLTVFYGASGVGKSSVLLAGTVPLLKLEPNLSVVVFRNWQDPSFTSQLKQRTLEAVSSSTGKQIDADLSLPLDEFLGQVARGSRGPLFLVFDQFEEYFLYNPPSPNSDTFEAEFARAVNRRDLNVNFLLSLREDGLSKLDRFQGRIPTLMNNMLRLEHLDREGAREAITKPLEEYNRQIQDKTGAVTIEPSLVEAVLDDLRGAKVNSEQMAQGRVESLLATAPAAEIETPLLQMVLTRLWDEERAAGSRVLRLQTFEKLGRAANIARTHLDTVMKKLTESEWNDAASILRYLVTPSGTKIAQETGALASWTELAEPRVQAILNRLSAPDMRILRTMQAPGQPMRYEIFHDVLAQAILTWRRRYVARQQEERVRREEQERVKQNQAETERRLELERARRSRRVIIALSAILVIMAAQMGYAFWQRTEASRARQQLAPLERRIDEKQKEIDDKQKAIDGVNNQLENISKAAEHMRKGQIYVQARKYSEGIQEIDRAIEDDPTNPNAYNQQGYAYLRSGKYQEAVDSLNRSLEIDPNFVWGHYNLALAYWAQNQRDQAVKEVEAVLKIDPSFRDIIKSDGQFEKFKTSPDYVKLIEPADSQK
jgi:tetratricopeptide (TPR) repeat protein